MGQRLSMSTSTHWVMGDVSRVRYAGTVALSDYPVLRVTIKGRSEMAENPSGSDYPAALQKAQALYEDYVRIAQVAELATYSEGRTFFTATPVADNSPIVPILQVWVS